jgi:hypothetical protein
MEKVRTSGDVIVNEIKIGDIHYEYNYRMEIKTEVVSKPNRDNDGLWSWKSKRRNGDIQEYSVHERYVHYAPKLYTYQAYKGMKEL